MVILCPGFLSSISIDMVSLIIRPSGLENPEKAWSLQLRYHDLCGTDYVTLCRVDDSTAREIIDAGPAAWLFGEPNWADIYVERKKYFLEQSIEKAQKELDEMKKKEIA